MDAGSVVGTPCDPASTTDTDTTCVPYGLVCQPVVISDGGIIASCVLPGDQDACLPDAGCISGFSCVPGVFAMGPTCVQQCTHSTDCQSVIKICVPQLISSSQAGCGFTGCGSGVDYYATCSATGSADGTCIPFMLTATDFTGLCVQGGSLGENQPCASQRGTAPGLCQPGLVCVQLTVSNGGAPTTASACRPVCNASYPPAPDGGPGCDSQSVCAGLFQDESYGACMQTCVIANPSCPPPFVCLGFGDQNTGICGPG
jgi:hypothetical protein